MIRGMRAQKLRGGSVEMIEARAEGTDLHQAWKKGRQFKQKPAAYLAERRVL